MRRTTLHLLLLLAVLAVPAGAEPILRGYHLPQVPDGKSVVRVPADKGVILAHVFNADPLPLASGKYEIGLELRGTGKSRTYVVKPPRTIAAGELRTFRMQIPRTDLAKNSSFRVFSRQDGKSVFSEVYALGGSRSGPAEVKTLYTEAPPEADTVTPPEEVPFEGEAPAPATGKPLAAAPVKVATRPAAKPPAPVVAAAPAVLPARPVAPPAAKPVAPAPAAAPAAPRTIDPKEFKTLRTIDEELVIYVVKKGDTLRNVAAKYYGDEAKEKKIMDLNFIDHPQAVRVGEEIIVDVRPMGKGGNAPVSQAAPAAHPSVAQQAVAAPAPASPAVAAAEGGNQIYVVQTGDTLGKLAKRFYGKSLKASLIMQANPGINPTNLKVGTTLVIPSGKGEGA